MKKLILLLLFITVSTMASAQSTWTGAGSDTNWDTEANWSPPSEPTTSSNVIIPTGFTVTLNVASSIKSIDLQGNSVFEMNSYLTITTPSTFGVNTTVNWNSGTISGNTTLTASGVINMLTNTSHTIQGGLILDNQGILNVLSAGPFWINGAGSNLNNPIGGIIDLQEGVNISSSSGSGALGVLNNAGLIKKTGVGITSQITILMNNNNGIIQVEEGTLYLFNSEKNLNDGIYNVFTGATMDWSTTIKPTGTLTGTIDGDLNWTGVVNIPTGETATFNFSEDDNFNWNTGNLSAGGTLINSNVLKAVGGDSRIIGGTTLDNQGVLNVLSSIIVNDAGSTLKNSIGGIINMPLQGTNILSSTGSGFLGVLNNEGLIIKSGTGTLSTITMILVNIGTINVEAGVLVITESGTSQFTNEVSGIVKGIGVIDLPAVANYTNKGTFAPGLSPGELTVQGNFVSTATSVLDIELNGFAQGTEYDLLDIQGNAVLEGNLTVSMSFVATVGEEFTILTANDISSCNLPTTVNAFYDDMVHTFDVVCSATDIKLKVINVELGSSNVNLATSFKAYPNPTKESVTIDLGSTFSNITVTTSNLVGKKLAVARFKNMANIPIQLNNKPGFYFLNIITETGISKTIKILKIY